MPKDDLAGKNLDDIGLDHTNLEKSDLSKSSLRRSNLRGTNLRGANLAGTDLRDAHLQDADVTGADLSGADLSGASLAGVDLEQAATIDGLTLTGATGLPEDGAGRATSESAQPAGGGAVKDEVLARIDAERAAWESLIDAIPVGWIELPDAIGDWSVKDVIAHISAWRQPYLDDFLAVVQGTPLPPSGWPHPFEETDSGTPEAEVRTQAVNDWIHERNALRTDDQVLAEASLQWTALRAIVTAMPDRLLDDTEAFGRLRGRALAEDILSGHRFAHFHDEHEPGIRAWLTRMHGRPAAG